MVFGTEGRGFESCRARQTYHMTKGLLDFSEASLAHQGQLANILPSDWLCECCLKPQRGRFP